MESKDATVELRAVTKRYDENVILQSFDLHLNPGELVALTGPSGSGKSTVLNLIGLLDAPDTGQVSLSGQTAPGPRSRAAVRLRRRKLGYLFQNFALIDDATVEQNLRVALAYTRPVTSAADTMMAVLDEVGLAGMQGRRVHTLSGGEQQRVAIARLLVKPCEVILADEPTASLDPENTTAVLDLLHTLSAAGKAVLVATHDPALADRCSRTVQLPLPRLVER